MKKNQEAKFQILFVEKFQKIQEVKFENLTHENLAFFLGDVQPKMCGINFHKNKQSCYQLLSKTSKVVISCYRVNTSKNRVVIKNKQSCYQLLSVVIGGVFLKKSENINQKNVWERPTFSKFCLRDIPKHFWPNMFGRYLPKKCSSQKILFANTAARYLPREPFASFLGNKYQNTYLRRYAPQDCCPQLHIDFSEKKYKYSLEISTKK